MLQMTTNADFDDEFDALPSASAAATDAADICNYKYLGVTVEGSNREIVGLLDPIVDSETINLGSYAVVEGNAGHYLCMVTDERVQSDRDKVRHAVNPGRISQFRKSGYLWTDIALAPHLLRRTGEDTFGPVRTVPTHLRPIRTATQEEISLVFGDGTQSGFFHIGAPLDMQDVSLAIDLRKLAQRSVGLFGQSGTGKSYLGRMLLAGVIRDRIASALIFDMHSEYGWQGGSEDGHKVKGLKQLFPTQVSVFTLDDESSRRRGSNPDYTIVIGRNQIEPEDMEAVSDVLGLSEPQIGAIHILARRWGKSWLEKFLDDAYIDAYGVEQGRAALDGVMGLQALSAEVGVPTQTLAALRRRLEPLRKYGFLQPKGNEDVIDRLMRTLDAGNSVVIEFGKYGNMLSAYMFVANFLTRRIHSQYVTRMEAAFGGQQKTPTPLMIVIEEAHKFLDPAVVEYTIFGTIARELRKYNVTMFVIDQRPSKIDPEVMSQIATRITALLTETNDIAAVLSGVNGADGLRDVLSRLDARQQAMILGYAVPIPVVVQTRTYDTEFYKTMGWKTDEELVATSKTSVARMRGPEDFNGFD